MEKLNAEAEAEVSQPPEDTSNLEICLRVELDRFQLPRYIELSVIETLALTASWPSLPRPIFPLW